MGSEEVSCPCEVENPNKKLAKDITITISMLGPPLSSESFIYRVPKKLREVNEAAYTPHLISIGPLHYGKEALKDMEIQKLQYLQYFLERDEITMSLEELIIYIREKETRIRQCYAENIDSLSSDQFVKMVLVDAAFIIELFLRYYGYYVVDLEIDYHDFIFHKIRILDDILRDLILLENQLPFFILKDLYDHAINSYSEEGLSLRSLLAFESNDKGLHPFDCLTLHYFERDDKQKKGFPKETIKHFTDLLRHFQLLSPPPADALLRQSFLRKVLQCIKYIRTSLKLKFCHKKGNQYELLYSASELHEAGVKFEVSKSKYDIEFTDDGKLVIPSFTFQDSTESFIRNLMAFEQYHYPEEAKICDYIILMDYLINTEKDVELLIQKKILVNRLGDHCAVASLVNKLALEINEYGNHYCGTLKKLNEYYEVPYHRWKATLRHEYFKTPWRSASTIAAFIFLVLTAIQTICSVLN